MTSLLIETENFLANPLDLAEQVIIDRDWAYDRADDDELVAEVSGKWCNYRVWFNWQAEMGALIFSCAFESKIPEYVRSKVFSLMAKANEKLWLGHFEFSGEENCVTFRHSMLLRGGAVICTEQLEDILDIAFNECERFYPAFQSVIWGGKSPEDAMQIAVFDTVGEA